MGTPDKTWLVGPTSQCVEYLGNEIVYAGLVQRGVHILSSFDDIIQLAKAGANTEALGSDIINALDRLGADARQSQPLAQEVLDDNFKRLYRHSAVGMWSSLETMMEHLTLAAYQHFPDCKERIAKTHSNLSSAKWLRPSSDDIEKRPSIYERALRDLFPNIMNCYQEILRPFDVDVNLSYDCERRLTEMSEVRNVVLHQGSVVDARFLQKCPWSTLATGDEYVISFDDLKAFHEASSAFVLEIMRNLNASKN